MTDHKTVALAIVGSQSFKDEKKFMNHLNSWIDTHCLPSLIVSGGAKGADTLAEKYCEKSHVPIEVIKPDYKSYGRKAPLLRNTQIVQLCTHVLAFPSKTGSGTQDTIRKAKNMNKDITIHWVGNKAIETENSDSEQEEDESQEEVEEIEDLTKALDKAKI